MLFFSLKYDYVLLIKTKSFDPFGYDNSNSWQLEKL